LFYNCLFLSRLVTLNPDFATGGILWFTNLSAVDPTYILPIMGTALSYGASIVNRNIYL
jgi:membrane protein insertase Oxa1/YidC/SpoIIIJ